MVQSCARIISELKTLIKLQNGGNFIIDILNICKFLFLMCAARTDTHKKKQKQKNKTAQQQKTMVIRNVASKKSRAMLYSWSLTNRWCILGTPFQMITVGSAFWLHHLVATMTNSQNTHIVMTEKSPQSPTSIRLTTILWWRQIAGGWRTLNSVYTLRKNSCLNQEAN